MSKQKDLECQLAEAMVDQGDLPKWETHFCFNQPTNRMEFDFAWPEYKLAIEVDGGQWSRGKMGHNSGTGVERDARKGNYAILKGWTLLRFVTDHIEKEMDQYTIPAIREALLRCGAPITDHTAVLNDWFNDNPMGLESL